MKEDTKSTNSQTVFRREIRQALDISIQVIG